MTNNGKTVTNSASPKPSLLSKGVPDIAAIQVRKVKLIKYHGQSSGDSLRSFSRIVAGIAVEVNFRTYEMVKVGAIFGKSTHILYRKSSKVPSTVVCGRGMALAGSATSSILPGASRVALHRITGTFYRV